MNKKTFDLIEKISIEHSRKTFGYLDKNDLKNEIWAICLEKLPDFKSENGPLENWLRVVVKNRLVNRFKDITKSVRSPCPRCPFYDVCALGECAKFGEDKTECKKWRNYQLSINQRNDLLNSTDEKKPQMEEIDSLEGMISEEIKEKIRGALPEQYIYDLEKLFSNEKISKSKAKRLKKEITLILEDKDAS